MHNWAIIFWEDLWRNNNLEGHKTGLKRKEKSPYLAFTSYWFYRISNSRTNNNFMAWTLFLDMVGSLFPHIGFCGRNGMTRVRPAIIRLDVGFDYKGGGGGGPRWEIVLTCLDTAVKEIRMVIPGKQEPEKQWTLCKERQMVVIWDAPEWDSVSFTSF